MPVELKSWHVVDCLDTRDRIALYIEAVIEDGDPALLAATLEDIARARGIPAFESTTSMGAPEAPAARRWMIAEVSDTRLVIPGRQRRTRDP